jgi:hypothetical protein
MKKLMMLGFMLALALSASAQSNAKTRPNAHGTGKTVSVPPVAKVPPVVIKK